MMTLNSKLIAQISECGNNTREEEVWRGEENDPKSDSKQFRSDGGRKHGQGLKIPDGRPG